MHRLHLFGGSRNRTVSKDVDDAIATSEAATRQHPPQGKSRTSPTTPGPDMAYQQQQQHRRPSNYTRAGVGNANMASPAPPSPATNSLSRRPRPAPSPVLSQKLTPASSPALRSMSSSPNMSALQLNVHMHSPALPTATLPSSESLARGMPHARRPSNPPRPARRPSIDLGTPESASALSPLVTLPRTTPRGRGSLPRTSPTSARMNQLPRYHVLLPSLTVSVSVQEPSPSSARSPISASSLSIRSGRRPSNAGSQYSTRSTASHSSDDHPTRFPMNSGMTTSPPQSSIHIVTVQLDARTTARDVVKLALAELFGFHSEADWRNRQNILERYALFETEFVDGGDEDVSLAAAVTRRPSVASVVPSSTPTSTTTTRRIHRIVRGNEHPLIIHANWPNYKPLPRRRRASDSYSSPVPHQQRRRRASSNDRHFDFFVAELTDEDRVVAALSNGDYRPAYAEAMAQGAFGTTMSSSMLEMSEERLRRRLAIVNKEELRVVEECRDRYARLKALVTARAKSLLGGGNYNERGAAPRM